MGELKLTKREAAIARIERRLSMDWDSQRNWFTDPDGHAISLRQAIELGRTPLKDKPHAG